MTRVILIISIGLILGGCSVDNTIQGSYKTASSRPGSGQSDGNSPDQGGDDGGNQYPGNGDDEEGVAFSILKPTDGEGVSTKSFSTIEVDIKESHDLQRIASVEFYIGNGMRCEVFEYPFECIWRVPAVRSKTYEVSVYLNTVSGKTYYKKVLVSSKEYGE